MKTQLPSSPTIFSTDGFAAALRAVIDHAECPQCERRHAFTPLHLGRELKCDCGAVIKIGERCLPPRQTGTFNDAKHAVHRKRNNSVIFALASLSLFLAIVAGIGWTTSHDRPDSPVATDVRWDSAAIPGTTVAASQTKRRAAAPHRHRASADITLAQIEGLRSTSDLRAALVQARLWDDLLSQENVLASDRRRAVLAEIMRELVGKLTPPLTPSPACIGDLLRLTRELRDAIDAEDINRAHDLLQRSERLAQEHPLELAPYADSLQVLKDRLGDAERLLARVPRIESLLRESRRLATTDVTAARECEAWAKFLAFHTPLRPAERDHLEKLVRELQPVLLLARGTRAVNEVERCVREGDAHTRDTLVAEAREFLPGFPESDVLGLLRRAAQAAKRPMPAPNGSTFGQCIAFRRQYELTLEAFSTCNSRETIKAAELARERLLDWQPSDLHQRNHKLADLVLTMLESEVSNVPEQQGHVSILRSLLEASQTWQGEPRWQTLWRSLMQ